MLVDIRSHTGEKKTSPMDTNGLYFVQPNKTVNHALLYQDLGTSWVPHDDMQR